MDRQLVYPGAIPLETDVLNSNKYAMIGMSKLAAAVLGTGIVVNGFTCIPTAVASLQVQLTAGEIYSIQNIDATAYSSLAADTTHQIVKQGILLDTVLLTASAPATAGQSINWLVQVSYQDSDLLPVVLPYYNASNPSVAYGGPNNAGTTNNTIRKGVATVSIKSGIAATSGSQTTPAADAGYTGMFVVTVANAQTTITSSNISTLSGAPFITETLTQKLGQSSTQITAIAGGSADALTVSFTPAFVAIANQTILVRASLANSTTTPTIAVNGLSTINIVKGNNLPLAIGDIAGAGHWLELTLDTALNKAVLQNPANGIISISPASIQGAFKNLQASATGLSAIVTVTADEIAVENSSNAYQTLRAVNLSVISTATTGANGLDTGTIAISTWYSVWVIWNGTTTAGLLSLSAIAPTMPTGYTHKARVGWIRTDATANKYPLSFIQFGRDVQYKLASSTNVTILPQMASGTATAWTLLGVSGFIPTTASRIKGAAFQGGANATAAVMVAPNNSWATSGANSSSGGFGNMGVATNGDYGSFWFDFILESTNIYWGSTGAANSVQCFGWTDNI